MFSMLTLFAVVLTCWVFEPIPLQLVCNLFPTFYFLIFSRSQSIGGLYMKKQIEGSGKAVGSFVEP